METSSEDLQKSGSSHCRLCQKRLFPLIGGTRCDICSDLYIDFKFCSQCISDANIIEDDDSIKKICDLCVIQLTSSKDELDSMPDKNKVLTI